MPQSPGVYPQSPTIPLNDSWSARQGAARQSVAELERAERELATRRTCLVHGGAFELVSALTGAPMWGHSGTLEWIARRAMIEPPGPGDPSTRWVVRRADGATRAIEYGARVMLFNPMRGTLLNARSLDRGIEVTHAPNSLPDDAFRRFFFIDPRRPDNTGPIGDGDPVLLLCDFTHDPVSVVAPVVKNGSWFLERMPLDVLPAQTFHVRVLDGRDAAGVAEATRRRDEIAARVTSERRGLELGAQTQEEIARRLAVSLSCGVDTRLAVAGGPALARLNPPSALTIEARALLHEQPGDWMCLLSKGDWGARDYHLWVLRDGTAVFLMHTVDGTLIDLRTPPGALQRGRWHQIACIADVARMRVAVFVDGEERAAAPLRRQLGLGQTPVTLRVAGLRRSGAPLVFGRSPAPDDPACRLLGHLDEVRIWNAARSQADLRDGLYRYANGDEPGLVGCWRLGDVVEGVVPDITGGGNDGVFGR